jgi:hypothetical protein
MGAFGKEAIQLCILLAEFGDESCNSVSLQRIYQRPSVGITANIECQVETLRRLITTPLPDGGEEAMPPKKMSV